MASRALPLLLTVMCITDTAFSDEPSYALTQGSCNRTRVVAS